MFKYPLFSKISAFTNVQYPKQLDRAPYMYLRPFSIPKFIYLIIFDMNLFEAYTTLR